MGIFKKKQPYHCKILERYRINIEKTNLEFMKSSAANECGEREYCEFLDEDDDYRFFSYQTYSDGSGGYVLRQDKNHPRKVVYFGECKIFNRIFKGHLFQVDAFGCSGFGVDDFGVSARNIENGEKTYFGWLSHKTVSFESLGSHPNYQDTVNHVKVEKDKLTFQVTRRRAAYATDDEYDEYDIDTDYDIVVVFDNGRFKATAIFP